MKKNIFALASSLILLACNNKQPQVSDIAKEKDTVTEKNTVQLKTTVDESEKTEIEPYDYDTILKNGYHLSYRVYKDTVENELLQSLTLVKGKKDIAQISETSYPMLHKNLGYLSADYGKTFLFVQSYGSGNPHELQLIEKQNGKVLTSGTYVDDDEAEQVLLYIQNEHEDNEKLILLDLKSNKEKTITDFNNLDCSHVGALRNCIEIDTVTKKEIIIKTNSEQDNITKKYKR